MGEWHVIVELIAHTTVMPAYDKRWGAAGWQDYTRPDEIEPEDADKLAEFAGRLCYQSWSRPNPATVTNEKYIANILAMEHFSVTEHASATFYVAGVSRSLSHELVRHRFLSFSQLSQRFVDEKDVAWVPPPAIVRQGGQPHQLFQTALAGQRDFYAQIAIKLERAGLTRKQAREAARAVLPNATETRFVVTGNMRAWRDVLTRRLSPAADAEIQQFAQRVLAQLKKIAPNTFQDFT
jgi:thymidylate synthase (FAD)